eukprot:3904524-Rhodomonas_salina.1
MRRNEKGEPYKIEHRIPSLHFGDAFPDRGDSANCFEATIEGRFDARQIRSCAEGVRDVSYGCGWTRVCKGGLQRTASRGLSRPAVKLTSEALIPTNSFRMTTEPAAGFGICAVTMRVASRKLVLILHFEKLRQVRISSRGYKEEEQGAQRERARKGRK